MLHLKIIVVFLWLFIQQLLLNKEDEERRFSFLPYLQ